VSKLGLTSKLKQDTPALDTTRHDNTRDLLIASRRQLEDTTPLVNMIEKFVSMGVTQRDLQERLETSLELIESQHENTVRDMAVDLQPGYLSMTKDLKQMRHKAFKKRHDHVVIKYNNLAWFHSVLDMMRMDGNSNLIILTTL